MHYKELGQPAESNCEIAMFATAQAVGILDLGASQTVMGQHQVPEFLESLPANIRKMVHERPVEMTSRFGNNSIVPCTRAMFVPVDQYRIKIAIVESRTPFLILKRASRHNGVHCFDISTSKSGPELRCFVRFDLEMCFAPQRRAIFNLSSGQLALHRPL